jgi:two-component system cell cycle sensor histidine kinase/response regulator CckA
MIEQDADAETVLVVDDDHNVRTVMASVLRRRAYRVLEATDGTHALEVVAQHAAPVHLIVSDVNMPGMDGWLLLEQLRGWYPGIRFLMVSGDEQAASTMSNHAETPTAFLAKPFSAQQLSDAVRALLDRPRFGRIPQ